MKIENFDECKSIIERIKQHEETLSKLKSNSLTVAVNYDGERGRITTIGVFPNSEHDQLELAAKFISWFKEDLENRIVYLKCKLEAL
jgi:hypothetical protein